MDPSDYDVLHITQGDLVAVRTAGFQAILNSRAQAGSLTSKSDLAPLSGELLDQTAKDALIEEHSILGINQHHIVSNSALAAPEASSSTKKAPPPPKPGKGHGIKYDQHLQKAYNASDPKVRDEYINSMKALLEVRFDPQNTSLSDERHRAHMAGLWYTFIKHHIPALPESRYWDEDILREWIELFLVNLVQCTTGRSGKRIRSSTLRRWLASLLPMIGRYASGQNGEAVGAKMLSTGFYLRLRAREKWIVEHFQLDRFPATRGYLSQRDIQAIFEFGFDSTETFGRQSFIQTHLSFIIVFQTAIRASSFAAGHAKYKEWGHFIKLRDLTILVEEPGMWTVDIKVFHRKGNNEMTDPGYALDFRLGPVHQVHNIVFDAGLILLAHLVLLDALLDIKNIAELFAYRGKHIRIKPSMMEEPLFRARDSRGHNLTDKPASSGNMQESIRRLGRNIGIPATKYHDVRRDAGNFGIVFGAESGRRLLGHEEGETVFDRNYSRGTWNFDITAARLGELDSTLNPAAQNNEIIQMLDHGVTETWAELHKLLPRWVYLKYEAARGSLVSIEAAIKELPWFEGVKEEFERLKNRIHELSEWRVDVARQVLKRVRHKTTVQLQEEFQEQKEQHTLDEYKEIEDALVWDSAAVELDSTPEDLVRAYKHRFFNFDPSSQFREQLANLELLTPEIRQQFKRPDMVDFLAEHIQQHYHAAEDDEITFDDPNDPEPTAANSDRDAEIYQAEDIGPFDDSTELPVFNVDFMTTRIIFFIRLVNPVYAYLERMQKFKENDDKFICQGCTDWGHLRLPNMTDSYKTYAHYMRHMKEIHTPWADLRIKMITDDPEVLECPSDSCTYTGSTVDDIFSHCLDDCPEKGLFQKVHSACQTTRKRDDEAIRSIRKRARALVDGIDLADRSLETMEIIATASDDELMQMAEKAKFNSDDDHLQYRIPLIREMVRLGLSVLDANENMIRNPYALECLKSMGRELITAEDERWIEEQVAAIDPATIITEPHWAPDELLENLSQASSGSSRA
ncbi:hypothetical protein RSAG8_00904, partial [Rhizoctonia solani AG-8 WAC10335]